jgi:hypothetical protein
MVWMMDTARTSRLITSGKAPDLDYPHNANSPAGYYWRASLKWLVLLNNAKVKFDLQILSFEQLIDGWPSTWSRNGELYI